MGFQKYTYRSEGHTRERVAKNSTNPNRALVFSNEKGSLYLPLPLVWWPLCGLNLLAAANRITRRFLTPFSNYEPWKSVPEGIITIDFYCAFLWLRATLLFLSNEDGGMLTSSKRCLLLLERCKNVKQLKQSHAQVIMCGLGDNNFCLEPIEVQRSINLKQWREWN